MCGITGIFNIDGRPVSVILLKKMTDIIAHRGPDGEGFWKNSFIGFGHRRLAVIDLSPAGHQPMQTDDGNIIITYNGEVYNFQEIRNELESKGYKFHSRTDVEVVLKAYVEWDEEAFLKLNGMFALAIWDNRDNRFILARDRYGIIPVYYYLKNNTFIFASEIKSILQHPEVSVNVSIPALNEYFSFQNIFSDLTLFKDIKLLPAATILTLKLGDVNSFSQCQYWDYNFEEDNKLTEQDCVKEATRLFEQAVNRQLISDVEIGSYLSGGMDSGSVTCIAAKNFKNLKTFTCGFDLSSASGLELGFDEREKAEYLSNLYKTEHYEVILKAGDMERIMPDLIWHIEDLRVGQSYPNYYVTKLASKFLKVVLAGAGGDELFGGYPWRYYRAVVNENFDQYLDKYYKYWVRLIPDSLKPKFFKPEIYPEIWNYQTKDVFKSVLKHKEKNPRTPEEYINNSFYFEIKTFLHGLFVIENKISMAHGLETRVPFMDDDLVNFAMTIPVRYKLKSLGEIVRLNENEPGPKTTRYYNQTEDGKIILRKVLNHFVPEQYTNGKKQGFSAPDASWFKGESINYIKNLLLNRKTKIYSYIQPETAKSLIQEHFLGEKNRRLLIWAMLSFEWWMRKFMP